MPSKRTGSQQRARDRGRGRAKLKKPEDPAEVNSTPGLSSARTSSDPRVRQQVVEALASAGLAQGRAALEVLFLLPPAFTRDYEKLFGLALTEDIRSSGDGGKDEGKIKAKAKNSDMSTRTMHVGGKAPKRIGQHFLVRDERALEVKRRIDRKLRNIVRTELEKFKREELSGTEKDRDRGSIENRGGMTARERQTSEQSLRDGKESELVGERDGTQPIRAPHNQDPTAPDMRNGTQSKDSTRTGNKTRCSDCGKIQSPTWKRCPFH